MTILHGGAASKAFDRLEAGIASAAHAARFVMIAASRPPGILALTLEHGLSSHHKQLCESLGHDSTQPLLSLIHPDDRPEIADRLDAAWSSGAVVDELVRCRRGDGRWQDTVWDVRPAPRYGLLLAVVRLVPLVERRETGGPSLSVGAAGQVVRVVPGGG